MDHSTEVVKQIIVEMRRRRRSVADIPPYIVPLSVQAMDIMRCMLVNVRRPSVICSRTRATSKGA